MPELVLTEDEKKLILFLRTLAKLKAKKSPTNGRPDQVRIQVEETLNLEEQIGGQP